MGKSTVASGVAHALGATPIDIDAVFEPIVPLLAGQPRVRSGKAELQYRRWSEGVRPIRGMAAPQFGIEDEPLVPGSAFDIERTCQFVANRPSF